MGEPATMRDSVSNLPGELTSFVGRRAERNAVKQLLSVTRLLTLTGFGGIGKTRLALRIASELRRAFSDGVCYVSLGESNDPEMLSDTIAAALGIQGRSTRTAPGSLVEYLGPRHLLLVLDNCEHLVDACAVLTDTLLLTCPRLRVLVTSREPLRIRGETVHQVAPLTFPGHTDSVTALRQFEAVSLFMDRARAVVPEFGLTDENRESIVDICRKLEGIPLALELAAVRLRAMSAAELAAHLSSRWELLTQGSRAAPDRQRTMADCIEWSFQLCSDEERAMWARVATFAGGFELDAAQAICRTEANSPDVVPDLLLALVDKSILIAEDHGDRMVYRMLSPIRQRGIRRLRESGKLTETRRQHRDWVVEMVFRAQRNWMSPHQIEWINRLRRELGNMQAALEFCHFEPNQAEPGLRMGASLLEFGLAEGLFRRGRLWFDRLLERESAPTEARALALRTSCWWAAMQGDLDAANRLLEEGQSIAAQIGEPVSSLFEQVEGFVAMFSGDSARAISCYEEALRKFRTSGESAQTAHTLALLALAHTFTGDFDRALACHEECMSITKPAGESWYQSYSLWIAGLASWASGNITEAITQEREGLMLKRAMDERLGIGLGLEALAWIAAPTDPKRAAILLGAAQKQWEVIETSTAALPGLSAFHRECVELVRSALGDKGFDATWGKGVALSEAVAIEYALGERTEFVKASESRRKPAGPGPAGVLTRRELQIAELVAQGMTNHEIASNLVISKRTAETHVEHIMSKLGFTSRHQITAWLADQSLPESTS